MSSAFTLTSLKNAIEKMVEDSGTGFTGNLNDLIMLAEDKCLIDLDLDIFDNTESVVITSGLQLAAYPAGFIKIRSLFYLSVSNSVFLEQRTHEYLIDYWPSTIDQSLPIYWSPYTETHIYLAPTPNAAMVATARGIKRPDSLTVDTGGTWISQNAGSLLFKACLVVAEQFNIADERIPMWKTEYAEDLALRRHEFLHLIRHEFSLSQKAV